MLYELATGRRAFQRDTAAPITPLVRTIGREPGLLMAARVVLRYLERSGALRRRRLDGELPPR